MRNLSRSESPACPADRIIFSATTRLALTCRALYTTPIPPRPRTPRISYPGTAAVIRGSVGGPDCVSVGGVACSECNDVGTSPGWSVAGKKGVVGGGLSQFDGAGSGVGSADIM